MGRDREALAAQALYSAQLLAGELPPEIEEVFADAGTPLFPASLGDLAMACSCPDWSVPCKHIAATFYLLAEDFDRDPFQLLRWRGRDRDTLLTDLRALRNDGAAPLFTPAAEPDPVPVGAAAALAEVTAPPPAEMLDRFWTSPVPLPPRPPTLDVEPDLLLRQLPEPGADLGGAELVDRLRPAYQRLGGADPVSG